MWKKMLSYNLCTSWFSNSQTFTYSICVKSFPEAEVLNPLWPQKTNIPWHLFIENCILRRFLFYFSLFPYSGGGALVPKWCLTHLWPMDCSPLGSSDQGFSCRILEWVCILWVPPCGGTLVLNICAPVHMQILGSCVQVLILT